MRITSLVNFQERFSEFVDSVQSTHERVVITRDGEPAAVLIAPDDLASLEETISLLSDPTAMAEINEARAAITLGETVSTSVVRIRSVE